MLRLNTSSLLRKLAFNETKTGNSDLALEFVRWRRKPRWLPVAKSKLFRVPERVKQDADERAELMRLNNNYHTQMRSVRLFLREELKRYEEVSTADHTVLTPEQEEEGFQMCVAENDAWNKIIAAERAQRLEKDRAEKAAYIKERVEAARMAEEKRLQHLEEIVKREKELASTHITLENLDEAIEHALANPVDYNFSIDMQGNLYKGRENHTEPTGGDNNNNDKTTGEIKTLPKQLMASN